MFCRHLIRQGSIYIFIVHKIGLSQEHAGALKSSSGDLCRCEHTNGPSCGLVTLILAEHSTPSQCSDTLRDAKGLHRARHNLCLSTWRGGGTTLFYKIPETASSTPSKNKHTQGTQLECVDKCVEKSVPGRNDHRIVRML